MPEKRAADTYLTDRGEESVENAEGATPVKMATAAQLARRKIAQPKSRMGRSGSHTRPRDYMFPRSGINRPQGLSSGSASPAPNLFGALNSNNSAIAPSQPFQQPQQAQQAQQTFGSVGGITFGGQSQSFPQDNSATSGFNFTAPSQNNPFASMNNPFANPSGNSSFSGSTTSSAPPVFGAPFSVQNGDVSMESPEKKQRPSSIFGQSQEQNQTQPQPPPAPLFQFGASPSTTAQPNGLNGLFAKPAQGAEKTDQQPSSNIFGLNNGATAGGFGASQPSATFQFGTSSSSAPTSSAPPLFGGASATSQPSAGQATPFKFGGATATTQPSPALNFAATTAPATAPAKAPFNLFANNEAAKSAEPKPAPFVFGQPASTQPAAAQPADAASSKPTFSFGTTSTFGPPKPADGTPAAQSNPFAALSKPPEPQDKAEPKILFGGVAPLPNKSEPAQTAANFAGQTPALAEKEQDKATTEAKNPFASLFGNKPAVTTTESDKPLTSPFKFHPAPSPAAPSSPASSAPVQAAPLFGTAPKPATSAPSLFNNLNKPTEPANEAPAFGNKAAPAATPQDKVSAIPIFSESVFEQLDTPCPLGRPAKRARAQSPTRNIPAKRLQTSFSEEPPVLFKPQNQLPTPIKQGHSLFTPTDSSVASSQPGSAAAAPSTAASTSTKKRLFQPFNSDAPSSQPATQVSAPPKQSPLPAFGSAPASTTDTPAATTTPKPALTGHVVSKPVFAQPAASSIPSYLNAEGYKEFDNQDKLRALNRAFRNKIMAVDVATHDIDTLLRAYVAARSSIGADIGLYQRSIAGTKRKTDEPAEPAVPSAYKKARSDPSATTSAQTAPNNIFGSVTQATVAAGFVQAKPAEPSRASQLLDGMIPKSPTKASENPFQKASDQAQGSPDKPRNAFASNQPLFGKLGPTTSATSMFGQPSTSTTPSKPATAFQPSTTPAKSPPKSARFPAFGNKAESAGKKRGAKSLEDDKDNSGDDSQAEGGSKSEEQDRAKKVKHDNIPKTGFTPTFAAVPTSANKPSPAKSSPFEPDSDETDKVNAEEASEDVDNDQTDGDYQPEDTTDGESEDDDDEESAAEEEDEVHPDDDEAAQDGGDEAAATDMSRDPTPDQIDREIAANPNKGMSLFDRISAPPGKDITSPDTNGNPKTPHIFESTTKPGWKPGLKFAGLGNSSPEQPAFSPFTPDPNFKPATTFNFTPSSTPTTNGADSTSVLGGASAKVDSKFEGMFGSRPSTPSQIDRPADAPTSAPAAPLDNTWKQGSPIKFGSSTPDTTAEPPKFSFTAPSPSNKDAVDATPKPFGGLFGKPAPSAAAKADGSLGFTFGQSSTTPAPGFLSAAPHLGFGSSATSSALSSRQSSPGLTDNESAATDVTDTEGPPPDEQAKINESRAGEEDEECVYEVATVKALRLVNSKTANEKEKEGTWITVGQGPLRLLKNKDGKTRLLIRNSTNGNPILNEYLISKLEWKVQQQNGKTGAIKGALVQGGILSQWVIKIKLGKEHGLCEALEEQRKTQE